MLLNLGGPDSLSAVWQFLFRLFNDKHIMRLPQPFRAILAATIATLRLKKAQGIYAHLGGKSPILANVIAQAEELEKYLNLHFGIEANYNVFPVMRYSSPGTEEAVRTACEGEYTEVILLPLYPQFSTTTTLSSFVEWSKYMRKKTLACTNICCYYNNDHFISAHAALLQETINKIKTNKTIHILFSAHSIPEFIVEQGDPYQKQVEASVEAIAAKMKLHEQENIQYSICYQSKVGKLKWLEPNTELALLAAGKRDEVVVMVPISFTSEHAETLVELDIEYMNVARENNIELYRVPALGTHDLFIKALASLVVQAKNPKQCLQASNCTRAICKQVQP